jgi:hypothetical protein
MMSLDMMAMTVGFISGQCQPMTVGWGAKGRRRIGEELVASPGGT